MRGAQPANQLRRRSLLDDAPVIDDRDAVAQPFGFFHVVRGQHDRAARAAKAQHQLPQLAARLRIQPGRRLVEEQDVRLADQRARDRQPLPLAARQLADPRVTLLSQLDVGQQRGDRPRRGG